MEKTGGMGRSRIGYRVSNADVTEGDVDADKEEEEEEEEEVSMGRVRPVVSMEEDDLRLFLGEQEEEESRRLEDLSFDLGLSFDIVR